MNSFTELQDYLIADEILRIQSLSRDELERELIDCKTRDLLQNGALSEKQHENSTRKEKDAEENGSVHARKLHARQ
jgi:hypothetical protein